MTARKQNDHRRKHSVDFTFFGMLVRLNIPLER
jgi:hypothetical protein